jgi:hypothetical protein
MISGSSTCRAYTSPFTIPATDYGFRCLVIAPDRQEKTMYQEKRPTCVTVIGWVWIIIGGLMCFSAIMALFSSVMIGEISQAHPEAQEQMPAIFRFFPLLAIIQIVVAIIGLVSGIHFLKLKAWSRNALEILTWVLLLFLVGFGIYWEYGWLSITSGHGPRGFDIMGAIMGIVIIGIYGVPLGIMVKYLKGNKVKNAMISAAESGKGELLTPPPHTTPDESRSSM